MDPFTGKPNPLFFPADAGLLAVAEKAALDLKLAPVKTASGERTPRVVTGVIVTGDAFVASLAKKDALRKEFKADATEMEGAAAAQICWQRRVPCLILRSLSDSAGAKAPENELLFEKSAAQNPRCSLPVLSGVSKRNEHSLRLLEWGKWGRVQKHLTFNRPPHLFVVTDYLRPRAGLVFFKPRGSTSCLALHCFVAEVTIAKRSFDGSCVATRRSGLIAVRPGRPICGRRIPRWRGKRGTQSFQLSRS